MKQSENTRQSAAKPNKEWRSIQGFSNYEVSNYGEVRNKKSGRILKTNNKKRYYAAALHQNGERTDKYVHRLVADAFIPNPDPERLKYVNHLDHNIHNNCVNNLEWCTSSENARHSYENNRRVEEYQTTRKWITEKMIDATRKPVAQYDLKGNLLNVFKSGTEAAEKTGVSNRGISFVCCGQRYTAGGYVWRYWEGSTTTNEENPSSSAQSTETSEDIV